MVGYGWLKSMTQLSTICGASPINNIIIFFGGHDIHFNWISSNWLGDQKIQPFVLNPGNSGNNHPNNNGLNSKMNYIYNVFKFSCMLKYGKTSFYLTTLTWSFCNHWTPLRCLLETSSGTYFSKKYISPCHIGFSTNTQSYFAYIKVYFGGKV